MRTLVWLAVLATAVTAAAVGWQLGAGDPDRDPRMVSAIRSIRPVPAADPKQPWTVLPACAPEPGPALATGLDYVRRHQVTNGRRWTFLVPRGWVRGAVSHPDRPTETIWVPPSGASYQLRTYINPVRQAPADLASWQTAQMQANYSTFETVRDGVDLGMGSTGDRISKTFYSFRTSTNACRLNFFAWLRPAGWSDTPIEMSVSGRAKDDAGLSELLDTVLDSFTSTPVASPDTTADTTAGRTAGLSSTEP